MSKPLQIIEQFRASASRRYGFLEGYGFVRNAEVEETTSTFGTVVYQGKHVGFIFSFDVRDQCVDARVVRVTGGQIKDKGERGYSSDILMHLIKHAGYRGHTRAPTEPGKSSMDQMVGRWAELLEQKGQILLEDQAESLPA